MEEQELDKYFLKSEIMTLKRSEMHPADYNPRKIDAEARKTLKRSLKLYGVVGGIIVNRQTGYTIVSGHQKVDILDEWHKYDPLTPDTDYTLRVEVVDVDLITEKKMNTMLNNTNAQGTYDIDKLRALVGDIGEDYKDAGLTEADLSFIGLDNLFKTEGEDSLADSLKDLMQPADDAHRLDVEQRAAERAEIAAAQKEANLQQQEMDAQALREEQERQARIDHMKDVKEQVKQQAMSTAADNEAFFMLSFDTWENKKAFCDEYGLDPYARFIKGEHLHSLLSGVLDE